MSRNIPHTVKLFDDSYRFDFPENQYFVLKFDQMPSRFCSSDHYDKSIVKYFINLGFTEIGKIETRRKKYEIVSQSMMINTEKEIIISINFGSERKENLIDIDFLYNLEKGDIETQLRFDEIKKFKRVRKKSNISLVKSEMNQFDVEEFTIPVPDINMELNYGPDFLKIHNVIIKRLNTDKDKGIVLLYGDYGTGKTMYIRHLTKLIKNKEILFIPPSVAEILSDPSIIPFLMEHSNSILIIEEGEKFVGDREINGSSAAVSNLLNLTDGILGDCLNVQIVLTFNTKKEKIDGAFLRKGRLIAEHEFAKLSIDNTNKLLKHLKKGVISDKPLVLADIYNIDTDEIKVTKEQKRIGF